MNDMDEAKAMCTWVSFYQKLADVLLAYKDDRQALVGKLQALYESIDMKFPKLDSSETPTDIDPYTVFGLFNKGISDANRRKIIAGMSEEFDIEAEQPRDFAGIPVLNNLNATFYAFVGDSRRGEHDIDNLWRVFEAELVLASDDSEENRSAFIEAFDTTVIQFGLGWKLTMGLYWVRPLTFINLDSRNRWFMGDVAGAGTAIAAVVPKERDAPIHDGDRYLAICDAVKEGLGTTDCVYADFPTLSNAAFIESDRVNKEKKAVSKASEQEADDNALGDAGVETVHYWLYSPGEDASMWDDFYGRGVMGLGWPEIGDLASYDSREEMREALISSSDTGASTPSWTPGRPTSAGCSTTGSTACCQRCTAHGLKASLSDTLQKKTCPHRSEVYGRKVVPRLATQLTGRYGKGYTRTSLYQYVRFYRMFPEIVQTPSGQSMAVLSWSHWVELLRGLLRKRKQRGGLLE